MRKVTLKVDNILFAIINSRKCLLVKLDKNSLSDISKTSLDSSENLWQCKIGCRKLPPHRLYQNQVPWELKIYAHLRLLYAIWEKETLSQYDNFNI